MKPEVMIIRMDKGLKEGIVKASENSRRSASDYVRLVVEEAVKKRVKV